MIKHYLTCDTCCCQWHNENGKNEVEVERDAQSWGWLVVRMKPRNSMAGVDQHYCPSCAERSKADPDDKWTTEFPDESNIPKWVIDSANLRYKTICDAALGRVELAQHTTAASGTQAPCGGLSDLQGEFTTESGVTFKTKEN